MPKKGKGKKKGGSKKKGKKGAKAAAEKEEVRKKCSTFLKIYQQRCVATASTASQIICQACRECIENEKALLKFVLEPSFQTASRVATGKKTPQSRSSSSVKIKRPESEKPSSQPALAVPSVASSRPPLLLQPLMAAWVEAQYSYMKVLHVWNMPLNDDAIVSLSLFLESPIGPNLKVLELRNTGLSTWAVKRLARSLKSSQLAVLNLDYNSLEQESMAYLCECLQLIPTLHMLSLDYCNISSSCCEAIGGMAAMSQIKELSLIGNSLECDGCTELMRPLVTICESSADLQAAAAAMATPTLEDLPEDPESPQRQPHPPSPLAKLFLQDNGIDVFGMERSCDEESPETKVGSVQDGPFASIVCMKAVRRWILSSPQLEEINLDGNNIGDGAARELMMALQERKEAGMASIRMTITPRVCPDIYENIIKLSASQGKKAKKKGKKKKK